MVVCPADHGLQADVIFVIEGTAVNGAYINDLKSNYIIPSLEYFNQSNVEEINYMTENANCVYGIVVYQAADCLPHPSSDTFGPFTSPTKLLAAIDKLELIGGKGESHANIAEGLATALQCFEELKRDNVPNVQKHCILVCNSPPYLLPVLESQLYCGQTAEQLAAVLQEKSINLSIISPRKIPSLYKLFEKAGGDLTISQMKNYSKDPRHLVLLKGFSLKERPVSPTPGTVTSSSQIQNPPITSLPSLPSPLPGNDSPISSNAQNNPNMVATGPGAVGGVGQNMYRTPNPQAGRVMGQPNQIPMQNINAPPQYLAAAGHVNRQQAKHWQMGPPTQQPRPYVSQNPAVSTSQAGSALIAQLSQPPSSMPATVNQFVPNINTSGMHKIGQAATPPNAGMSNMPSVSQGNQVQNPSQPNQQMGQVRERHTIWQGLLEWIEKPKAATDQQKITKHVPCQVSANSKDGEPELKADGWPPKLIMQLMPKHLIGTIGGAYLKNSKSVLFHPQPCDALESLTKVMSTGFAGCVHFTSTPNPAVCDIKVLILLYTTDKRAYLGFIPNDQVAFVDRLRKVIQQQKSSQQMRQIGGTGTAGPSPVGGGCSTSPQMGGSTPSTSQGNQMGMTIAQTNTLAMGGGQITQNVASNNQQNMGMMNQNVPTSLAPSIRMPGMQTSSNQQPNIQQDMMNAPVQRAPFENQLEVERRQNLEKINQLKQTLEAAQQQEQQYKSQLERISHMKTSQLQEALQIAQQTEMQFKMLDQQRQMGGNAGAGQPAGPNQQQQRMMRPGMANNPGLRHLLQQQPQYRQQVMVGMQQMGGNVQRAPMPQQMQNQQNNQQSNFDDVSNFDFINNI